MPSPRAGPGNLSGGNVGHAISIYDVVSDTVHQFAPAYHDYVLYSDGMPLGCHDSKVQKMHCLALASCMVHPSAWTALP